MKFRKPSSGWIAGMILDREIRKSAPQAEGKLLDIGCGSKPYRQILSKHTDRYIGLDWPNTFHGRQMDIYGDMLSLPFADGSFDSILCSEVIEHCSEPEISIREMERVLREKGVLLISAPFIFHHHEYPWDYYRYTREGLKYLLTKSGFAIREMHTIGGPFIMVAVELSRVVVITMNWLEWIFNQTLYKLFKCSNSRFSSWLERVESDFNSVLVTIFQVPLYLGYLICESTRITEAWPVFKQIRSLGALLKKEMTKGYYVIAVKKVMVIVIR